MYLADIVNELKVSVEGMNLGYSLSDNTFIISPTMEIRNRGVAEIPGMKGYWRMVNDYITSNETKFEGYFKRENKFFTGNENMDKCVRELALSLTQTLIDNFAGECYECELDKKKNGIIIKSKKNSGGNAFEEVERIVRTFPNYEKEVNKRILEKPWVIFRI
ncbi:MAG TPA: hypothetical protein VJZ93_01605 [Candidatus Nanoarchaeia archaeon]|nr:hypothetical protein [Candidatus Nanoarchaeia archaeon]